MRRNKSSMGSSASLKGDDHKKKKNIYSDSDSNTNVSESDSDSEHPRKTSKDSARISVINLDYFSFNCDLLKLGF